MRLLLKVIVSEYLTDNGLRHPLIVAQRVRPKSSLINHYFQEAHGTPQDIRRKQNETAGKLVNPVIIVTYITPRTSCTGAMLVNIALMPVNIIPVDTCIAPMLTNIAPMFTYITLMFEYIASAFLTSPQGSRA
jgi:hypothetical protein